MPGEEKHPHPPYLKEGQGVLGMSQGRENLRVTNVGNLRRTQRLLVDGCRAYRLHFSFHCQGNAPLDVCIGRPAAHRVNLPVSEPIHVNVIQIHKVKDPRPGDGFFWGLDGADCQRQGKTAQYLFKNLPASCYDTKGSFGQFLVHHGFANDFRPNSGRVPAGNGDDRFSHVSSSSWGSASRPTHQSP